MNNSKELDSHQAFLAKYEHQGFYALYPPTVVLLCVSVFGIFGNFNIVWASCRKRTLRSNCNILIASVAFADIFTQLSHFTIPYHLFFGKNFITFETCFWLQSVSLFFMCFASFMVLVIGVDRLFSVLMPVVYKQFDSKIYVLFMLMFPTGFGLFIIAVDYSTLNKYGQEKLFCFIGGVVHDSVKNTWIFSTLITNICIILVYFTMYVTIKLKNGKYNRRILKSLLVITILVLLGWLLGSLVIGVALQLGYADEALVKVIFYIGTFFINVSISLNYPVYMYFCKEYKIAFMEQLSILSCKNRRVCSTNTTSTVAITNIEQPNLSSSYN